MPVIPLKTPVIPGRKNCLPPAIKRVSLLFNSMKRKTVPPFSHAPLLFLFLALMVSCSSGPAMLTNKDRMSAIKESPQWTGERFTNPLERHDGGFWTILGRFLFGGSDHQTPDQPLPVVKRSAGDFSARLENGLRVTWLGHSTVLIEMDGYRVLTDPVWSERVSPVSFAGPKRFFPPPLPLTDLPDIDAVILSHDHFDHLDEATIKALMKKVPLFVTPLGVGAYMEEWDVPPEKIRELDWWQSTQIGTLTLTATPARHFSGRSLSTSAQNKTLWAGWSMATKKHRVFFSGDTGMFPEFKDIGDRLGPFDVTLMESGAYNEFWPDVHLGPEQAARAHELLRGKLFMPVHWGTFNLAMHGWTEPVERLWAISEKKDIRFVFPRPGESFDPKNPPTPTRWWPKLPWEKASERPVRSTGLKPVTATAGPKPAGGS